MSTARSVERNAYTDWFKAGLFTGDGTTIWSQYQGHRQVIVSPNSLEAEVTGITGGYSYTFG
ncbi:MAG: hypothetical protein IPF68_16910 [Bacteroidales bacterium]|nr:hypothetical protein [Bacteroidales bacterium]